VISPNGATIEGTDELQEKTKRYLTKDEVKAVMARRDKIVALLQKLIAEKGESEVLY
jgi:pyrroline-5-carboxylate reductase